MHITLIHRYFWPDSPPYASILLTIARHLAEQGHTVQVLTSYPSYAQRTGGKPSIVNDSPNYEYKDGVTIKRLKVLRENTFPRIEKILNLVYFPFRVAITLLLSRRSELIMCSTVPAVTMGFLASICAKIKGAEFVYHCMDIHPEVGKISGEFKNPLLFNTLLFFDSISTRIANTTIVLSEDMKNSLSNRAISPRNIKVINNFPLTTHESLTNTKLSLLDQKKIFKSKKVFRVLFAGNIGRFQNLSSFILAMSLLKRLDGLELVFLGEGVEVRPLKALKNSLKLDNVSFLPRVDSSLAREIIADADLGIVSLQADIYRYAFPSKTMTYIEEGCPLLLSVENQSQLSNMVEKNELGYVASDQSPVAIAEIIRHAVNQDPQCKLAMRQRCKDFLKSSYSENNILLKWQQLFEILTKENERK